MFDLYKPTTPRKYSCLCHGQVHCTTSKASKLCMAANTAYLPIGLLTKSLAVALVGTPPPTPIKSKPDAGCMFIHIFMNYITGETSLN